MVVEDNAGVVAESSALAAVGEEAGDDLDVRSAGEYRDAFDDG